MFIGMGGFAFAGSRGKSDFYMNVMAHLAIN